MHRAQSIVEKSVVPNNALTCLRSVVHHAQSIVEKSIEVQKSIVKSIVEKAVPNNALTCLQQTINDRNDTNILHSSYFIK